MRIFKYWARIESTLNVGGRPETVHCYGGSNESPEAAAADAPARLEGVTRRIAGGRRKEQGYEVDIREEVLAQIDARNVVTRNRYGAEVLNSADLMFIDIDRPRLGFFDLFRAELSVVERKARIVAQVKKLAPKAPELRGLGVRVYETHSGIRVIVTGRPFDPRAAASRKLLKLFHADRLYSSLCERQACFRARLTPKPFRIKCRTRKCVFPRGDGVEEAAHREWVAEYERRREGHATCRFLCALGHDVRDQIVSFHDAETGAYSGRRLA